MRRALRARELPGGTDGSDRISQIALNDMYRRARTAGVPLRSESELREATLWKFFAVCPDLQRSFDAYMKASGIDRPMRTEAQILIHRRFWFGWRKQVLAADAFARLPFLARASAQERVDLLEANDELRRHISGIVAAKALRGKLGRERAVLPHGGWDDADIERRRAGIPPEPLAVNHPAVAEYEQEWLPSSAPPADVAHSFEHHVHDSRAHFKLTDPQSEWDCKRIRAHLEQTARRHEHTRYAREQAIAMHDPKARQMLVTPALTDREREILEAYRLPEGERGDRPIFSDAAPATDTDGVSLEDIAVLAAERYLRDGRQLVSRRESGWSHLSRRAVFAFSRQTY